MNTWVRRSLKAGALTAGAVMATGTAAYADTTMLSTGNSGIGNGTQVFAPIQAPINVCGVAAGIAGDAIAGCKGGSAASIDGLYDVKMLSAGNSGILNGTQVFAPVQAPINICGVAVGVLGDASAWCDGGSSAKQGDHKHGKDCKRKCDHRGHYPKHSSEARSTETAGPAAEVLGSTPLGGLTQGGLPLVGQLTNGGLPLVGGLTQGGLPLVGQLTKGSLPLVGGALGGQGIDGIDIDALDAVGTQAPQRRIESDGGGFSSGGGTKGGRSDGGQGGGKPGSHKPKPKPKHPPHRPCPESKDVTMISSNNSGILNGTQIYAPIQVPVNVSGVAIGVLGDANAWSIGGASAKQ